MKISFETGKLKKCKKCANIKCSPIEFEFNFITLEIDCYWKREYFYAETGSLSMLWYFINFGTRYCKDGPANICYDEKNRKTNEYWYDKKGRSIKDVEYFYYDD